MTQHTLILLGKYGDVMNCLPMAYAYSRRGSKLRWLIGEEHASILDGVSYVEPEIWKGSQDTLLRAMQYVRSHGRRAIVAQAWKNPDCRMEGSFATEQWRLAGMQQHYGRFPLVFDQRLPQCELELCHRYLPHGLCDCGAEREGDDNHRYDCNSNSLSRYRPIVLVATTGISSPYKYADKLIATLRGLDAEIIDMDNVRASHVYDLLGLYERADCLVSVDTMHHHLARASYLPVVYLQNDGWKGAQPVPQVRASWRYADIEGVSQVRKTPVLPPSDRTVQVVDSTHPKGHVAAKRSLVTNQKDSLYDVAEAVRKQIERTCKTAVVVFPTYLRDGHNSKTGRHAKARASHPDCALYVEMTCRPKVRDLLKHGMSKGRDVVILTNDDVTFNDQTLPTILAHARKWDFGCSRRPEEPTHIGREIFWWRTDWLNKHFDEFPDCYWTLQRVDLILARWMRKLMGIPTTDENLKYDFPPVEIPAGLIYHEKHISHWNEPAIFNSPESQYNDRVWEKLS